MQPSRSVLGAFVSFVVVLLGGCGADPAASERAVLGGGAVVPVGVPARAGPVDGKDANSDEFVWSLFVTSVRPAVQGVPSPVEFETWASDADTFTTNPTWPGRDAPKRFQPSVLRMAKGLSGGTIDVTPKAPPIAGMGGFPTSGTPTPVIAEETKRNKVQFDYIKANGLNTKAGLAKAYASGLQVTMPTESLSVKGDWVPLPTLVQWIPAVGSIERARELYYTNTSGGVEYALVALHLSSRQNPNWVWGTFEHYLNPGRCDDMGCYDSFGCKTPVVAPNLAKVDTQYGPCPKSPALEAQMQAAHLAPAFRNYCLKSSQVDYTDAQGRPTVLGNSVIERIVGGGTVAASSCIGCHVYAAFDAEGKVPASYVGILPYNPTGRPLPQVQGEMRQFDFMWGVLLAPPR